MKLLDDYFALQAQIYEYFGFTEVWRVIPLADSTDYFWRIDDHHVQYADTELELSEQRDNYYESEVYRHRHMTTYIFRAQEFTLIAVDTNTDMNVFLQVFDNAKERPSPSEMNYERDEITDAPGVK